MQHHRGGLVGRRAQAGVAGFDDRVDDIVFSRLQPASVSARPKRRSAVRSSISPRSDELEPPAKSATTFLRLTAGRSNGKRVSSVMAAWRFRCFGRNPLDNEFLPDDNDLRHVRHYILAPCWIERGNHVATESIVHFDNHQSFTAGNDGLPESTSRLAIQPDI